MQGGAESERIPESIKESEDPESTRDFKTISGRVSDVRERVSESGLKEQMHESKSIHMREFNAILVM